MLTPFIETDLGRYAGLGYSYVPVSGLPWGVTEESFYTGASPAVANGDTGVNQALSSPDSFATTMSATGVPIILSGGSIARQTVFIDVYDESLDTWMGLTTEYVNDQAPTKTTSATQSFSYSVGQDVSIDLSTYFFDFEGDEMVYTVYSGTLPDGLTISGSILAGTVTAAYSGNVVFTATDIINATGNSPTFAFTVNAGTLTWPDLTGLTVAEAGAVLTALGLVLGTQTGQESTQTAGTVIGQDPTAGAPAATGDTCNVTVAQLPLGYHHRKHRPQVMEIVPQLTPEQQAVLTAREAAHKLFNRIPTMQGPVLTPIEAKVDALAKKMLS